ncbi:extracellular solute-binding protein [Bradyrhizobium sp. CCGUVB1N3]|uniref:ABC transporter substrate-binding protein n=1 Tax=Bradyrhizobium sp. CCGUVB1N3 TaxID=2949629 RepID=UPI0020B3810B|nr:extracellular solute-binding protein [Bradyrhizobium sp. CCGUVB1N3]MCP3476769.1 extracellular solute-binding protein [Bradyrhizobium sp. CCGUVB1N3]
MIDRRGFLTGSAVALLGIRPASSQADYIAELYAKAKTEGELTWYIVYWPSDRAEKHAAIFTKAFPGVRVNVVRATAQVAYQRLSQDIQANVANCDVFASTDMGQYVALKERGQLMPYKPRSIEEIDPRFLGVDPDNAYQVVGATTVGLAYNTNKVKPEQAPKTWKEFIDPKWKAQSVVGHPGFSGFVGTWVVQMNKLYGWDYFEQLAALKPHVGRSIIDTVTVLVSGERSVAASPSALVLRSAAQGNPIAVSYPDEGSVLMISGSAIMRNSKHPNAAKLFMEFLYSAETAGEDIEEFGVPLRRDVAVPAGFKKLDDLKTIRPTIDEIIKGIPELTEKWRDTFGV